MILVYLEGTSAGISSSSLSAIAAALELKERHGYDKIVGLLVGSAVSTLTLSGVDDFFVIDEPVCEPFLAPIHAKAVTDVVKQLAPTAIVAASTARGKDLLPRVAGCLGAGMASDVIEVLQSGRVKRPVYAGNVIAEVEVTTTLKIYSIRATAFKPTVIGAPISAQKLSASFDGVPTERFLNFNSVKSERPELTSAQVVVSGGRALKSAESFDSVLSPLADLLGAAIGASRAAVDSGYAPNDWQVGQTGKIVAPELYIAVGISGAIQHLAGMKDSKVIVAINSDPEAPIFEVADYGLVGDLFQIVPELVSEISKIK